ncbi:MAG: hypothetical protein LUD51_02480 [Clostridia bacterium]|nr:hypothetical protein [Clostridia bacterium]
MRKRLAAIIMTVAVALCAIAACLGVAACTIGDVDAEDKGTLVVETQRDVGEYSGHEVYYAKYYYAGSDVNAVVTTIEIDGVYIFSPGDPSYTYVVDLGEGEYIRLYEAYEQELISHDDLEAIAEAEAQYDGNRQYTQHDTEAE